MKKNTLVGNCMESANSSFYFQVLAQTFSMLHFLMDFRSSLCFWFYKVFLMLLYIFMIKQSSTGVWVTLEERTLGLWGDSWNQRLEIETNVGKYYFIVIMEIHIKWFIENMKNVYFQLCGGTRNVSLHLPLSKCIPVEMMPCDEKWVFHSIDCREAYYSHLSFWRWVIYMHCFVYIHNWLKEKKMHWNIS